MATPASGPKRAERDARLAIPKHAWTQADVAPRVGVSRQTINAIETGKFDPSLPVAFRLARLFDLKIEELFLDEQ
ncbi:helix-turn-helix transcriptional regulator [Arthrobacter sp. Y81]|uniref:helix-turn-helix transcriptional regulator n=1 Tax=Arthrobacter sp. Y81 TaxID=2058897 RepID=UPI000CE374FD